MKNSIEQTESQTKMDTVQTAVRAIKVTKQFRNGRIEFAALDSVDLDVNPGEMVAITGKSGSGKSTLLNVIAGLESIDQGLIEVQGRSLSEMKRPELARLRRQKIGFVFQNLNLLPTLSAKENVALPLEFDGMRSKLASNEASRRLEEVGVAELGDKFPSELSGGEQQRVAIARSLAGTKTVLLADEPTAALDDSTSREIMDLLAGLPSSGIAVIVATHDAELAAYADRIMRLKNGQVENISSRPETPSSPAELLS